MRKIVYSIILFCFLFFLSGCIMYQTEQIISKCPNVAPYYWESDGHCYAIPEVKITPINSISIPICPNTHPYFRERDNSCHQDLESLTKSQLIIDSNYKQDTEFKEYNFHKIIFSLPKEFKVLENDETKLVLYTNTESVIVMSSLIPENYNKLEKESFKQEIKEGIGNRLYGDGNWQRDEISNILYKYTVTNINIREETKTDISLLYLNEEHIILIVISSNRDFAESLKISDIIVNTLSSTIGTPINVIDKYNLKVSIKGSERNMNWMEPSRRQMQKKRCDLELKKMNASMFSNVYVTGYLVNKSDFKIDLFDGSIYYNVERNNPTKNLLFQRYGCRFGSNQGENINLIYCNYDLDSEKYLDSYGNIILSEGNYELKLNDISIYEPIDIIPLRNTNNKERVMIRIHIPEISCLY
jgi:hypothetical protein